MLEQSRRRGGEGGGGQAKRGDGFGSESKEEERGVGAGNPSRESVRGVGQGGRENHSHGSCIDPRRQQGQSQEKGGTTTDLSRGWREEARRGEETTPIGRI